MRDTHTRQLVFMCMRLLTMWLYEANRKEEGNAYYHQLICATFPLLTHVSKTHSSFPKYFGCENVRIVYL